MSGFPLALDKLETGKMGEVFPVREKSGRKIIQKVLEKSGNFGSIRENYVRKYKTIFYMESIKIVVHIFLKINSNLRKKVSVITKY